MRIETKFRFTAGLVVVLVLFVGGILMVTSEQVKQSVQKSHAIGQVLQSAFELNLLANDYFLYQTRRSYRQWYISHGTLLKPFENQIFSHADERKIVNDIGQSHQKLGVNFDHIVKVLEAPFGIAKREAQYSSLQVRLINQMLVLSQVMLTDARQLVSISKKEVLIAQQRASMAVMFMVLVIMIAVIGNAYYLIHNVVKPLAVLKQGSQVVGGGDLSYRIALNREDEIGELASAFDGMTQVLSETTVSREYFDNIIRSMVNTLLVLDSNANIQTINHALCELLGYERHELVGRPVSVLFEENQSLFSPDNPKVLADFFNIERQYVSKNGNKVPILISGSVMHNDKGEVFGIVCVAQDLTERKQLEKQLQQSNKMDALGKLTGGIAHDFNNMLAIMLGFCEVLQKQLVDKPELLKLLENITVTGKRGAELTSKLLAFAKQRPDHLSVSNLNQQIEQQNEILQKALTVLVDIEYELAPTLWQVNIDCSAFDDMLLNICINAKHAMSGNGKITFKTRNVTLDDEATLTPPIEPGDYVCLSVEDNGAGMPSDVLERIFDPFYTTKGELGTGLGLSQVYGFIVSSGGSINVTSSPGVGSCFTFYFPRTKIPADVNPFIKTEELSRDKVILIVDDEPMLANFAAEVLSEEGLCVHVANSGEQALVLLETLTVDLLFSDVIMPDMNGYQLMSQAKKLNPQIKVLLTSGFEDNLAEQYFNDDQPLDILYKPYSIKSLVNAVSHSFDV